MSPVRRWTWPVREYRYWPDLARLLLLWVLSAFGAVLLAAIGVGVWLEAEFVAPAVPVCGIAGAVVVVIAFIRMRAQGRFEPEPGPLTRAQFERQIARLQAYAGDLATQNDEAGRALAELRAQLGAAGRANGRAMPEGDYAALKRAFVRRYHPDSAASESRLAGNARAKVFADFYGVFGEIERQHKG